jgi:gamma-glutamylcyclotransferase (GGCT)/AIG2-like uncharacterized protein YtfP
MNRDIHSRLFVYGTLAPGQSGHSFLKPLRGIWQQAFVIGHLFPDGVGLTAGYPAIDLEQPGMSVSGYLFESDELDQHWETLDQYEGDGYRRVAVQVHLSNGTSVEAFVYALDPQAISKGHRLSWSDE